MNLYIFCMCDADQENLCNVQCTLYSAVEHMYVFMKKKKNPLIKFSFVKKPHFT